MTTDLKDIRLSLCVRTLWPIRNRVKIIHHMKNSPGFKFISPQFEFPGLLGTLVGDHNLVHGIELRERVKNKLL